MIYYIGYYNCDKIRNENRIISPASENKTNYIVSVLDEICEDDFVVVSPAETRLSRVVKGKKLRISDKCLLKTFMSFCSKNKLIRGLGHFVTKLSLIFYLLANVSSEDHLIVYHSLLLMNSVKLVKKLKKCKLTIEVEELYSDVLNDDELKVEEVDYLQLADNYIFVTSFLGEEVNKEGKRSIVVNGTYKPVPDTANHFNDEKIHVVYAGTFRYGKGVTTAISCAEFLDDNYVMEIMGTGSQSDIQLVKNMVEETSRKTKCKINYVGLKSGNDFDSYIQACHIGLSPQQVDAKFNSTSFPSKILMYMSNGLRVVSVKIPAVETSVVGDYITYYDSQDAEKIAQAVMSVDFDDDYDSRLILDKLHTGFVEQLKTLLFG